MENSNKKVITVAEDSYHKLTCTTEGFDYKPDTMRYVYGKSIRRPLEAWFLDELDFFKEKYRDYEIFTLGSSLVFGEKFINYLTICEFDIRTEQDFENLKTALWESDQAIRKKFHPMWKWDIAARKDFSIVFMVGHLDLAYFLQHRQEFRTKAHSRYMSSFIPENAEIKSVDYKVLKDGKIVAFDENLLSKEDKFVFENFQGIKYETIKK
ncbi:MAG: hypothetical protein K1X91_10185 [Bacteriodetes bacterium]|nr:hypothetical protein [Bacteroidota bacterium]